MSKRKADCTPEEWAEHLTKASASYKERYATDPEFRERMKQKQRDLRSDPDFIEKQKAYRARPEVRERHCKRNAEYSKRQKNKPLIAQHAKRYRQKPAVIERNRAKQRMKRGHTPELFTALLVLQDSKCAVCGRALTESAHADHCHDTGAPRGVLCRTCNTVEGHIKRTGLTPEQFGARLQAYLDNPPALLAQAAVELAG